MQRVASRGCILKSATRCHNILGIKVVTAAANLHMTFQAVVIRVKNNRKNAIFITKMPKKCHTTEDATKAPRCKKKLKTPPKATLVSTQTRHVEDGHH